MAEALGGFENGSAPTVPSRRGRRWSIVGAVLGLTMSLAFFAVAVRARQAAVRWRGPVSVAVSMSPVASDAEVEAVRVRLRADRDVKSFTFCNQTCAYDTFSRMFVNSPQFRSSVEAGDLPASFTVVPTHARLASTISAEMRTQPGVQQVLDPTTVVSTLATDTSRAEDICIGAGIASLLAAVFLAARSYRLRART